MSDQRPDRSETDPHPPATARALILELAAFTEGRHAALAEEFVASITSEIEILGRDPDLRQLLTAGVEETMAITMQIFRHGTDVPEVEPSPNTLTYARLFAQRGIPIASLERAFRLYQDKFLRWCVEGLASLSDDKTDITQATLAIMAVVSEHIDKVSQQLLSIYDREREAWLLNRNTSRSARIDDILAGRPVDIGATESTLGYRLGQHHLGMIVWIDRSEPADDLLAHLERSVNALADQLRYSSAPPLFEPHDERTGWVWLPLGKHTRVDGSELAAAAEGWDHKIRAAIGTPQAGVDGFVRTHKQATQAQLVVEASPLSEPRVVTIRDVGAVALMCSDLGATRAWVGDVLGPLATDDPASAQLRETLREFLSSGGSFTTTATTMHMHKNSVAYRVHKAEDLLGRSVREHRLELENALAACRWLGSGVLIPSEGSAASG
ncbi:MAG: helix-turn-helix domain-containing protein [Rhodococcus sp. (in: high G+C Gram-positive bacteria)]|uniref:PucR family transcriptional regulator n=1 Tax=Rhodococcus sp. TaxID=1831 RepID=UPI003BAFB03D